MSTKAKKKEKEKQEKKPVETPETKIERMIYVKTYLNPSFGKSGLVEIRFERKDLDDGTRALFVSLTQNQRETIKTVQKGLENVKAVSSFDVSKEEHTVSEICGFAKNANAFRKPSRAFRYFAVLLMHKIEGNTLDETAKANGVSTSTVKNWSDQTIDVSEKTVEEINAIIETETVKKPNKKEMENIRAFLHFSTLSGYTFDPVDLFDFLTGKKPEIPTGNGNDETDQDHYCPNTDYSMELVKRQFPERRISIGQDKV